MRLHVMRHGPAEDRSPTGLDRDRALTSEGRILVRKMGEAFRRGVATPPRILVSPRRRAIETAALVAEAFTLPASAPEIRVELDGEEPIPVALVDELAKAHTEALLVGHQPRVEELVRLLLAPVRPRLLAFRTATIVTLTTVAVGAPWGIESIFDPDQLPG